MYRENECYIEVHQSLIHIVTLKNVYVYSCNINIYPVLLTIKLCAELVLN